MSNCCCSFENCYKQPQPKKLTAIDFPYPDAILRAVDNTKQSEQRREPYRLPENLESFFLAKARKDEAEHQRKGSDTI